MTEYAHPEALVSTEWVAENLGKPNVKLVEVDVDNEAYNQGHIQGAVSWNWTTQLNDATQRDILSKDQFEALMSQSGISPSDTVILYGDNNNWFAAFALWQMKVNGHNDARLMNGGRKKWVDVENRPTTTDVPSPAPSTYKVSNRDEAALRARVFDVNDVVKGAKENLIDVRSPAEFSGEVIAPPGMTETAQRGGHIPGAANVPWAKAANDDGTFKSADELKALYEGEAHLDPSKPTIAYCRIGERSSHTWFALKYLLGYPDVRNYDGSWTEWGSMVANPIEK
ncbi:MAG TPA: sulfurtransferase [Tepidiformaceae bacterium]|nr:sulfurtransferase [Tepidiformaceae bacterium]